MTPQRSGLAARAHPFTPFAVALAVVVLAFLLPGPGGPVGLYGAVVALALLTGVGRSVGQAAAVCLPLWFFLFLLHGVLGDGPRVTWAGLSLARVGTETALAQAARLGAIATATFGLTRTFDPSRFLDAVAVRGGSFAAAYLVVATLQAVPRLGARVRLILEAQRTRGLRYGGSPLRRLRALTPLALPLILGALTEVESRAITLDVRGVSSGVRRTPLDPPLVRWGDRLARWAVVLALVAGVVWRVA